MEAPITDIAIDPAFAQSDADSAYDSEVVSYTTSLTESANQHRFENGRRYHSHKEGSYVFPNDEKEMDRLDIMHSMCKTALGDKLFSAPIKNPKRILDLATGTGIWALEVGDHFAEAVVIGNDLSPIQPRWAPPNVTFEVDDIEQPWTYSEKFDFIHVRHLYGCIKDWPRLVAQVFEFLKPGGYAEFTDNDAVWRSPDNTIEGTPIESLNQMFLKLLQVSGVEPSPGTLLKGLVEGAGFEVVKSEKIPCPIGTWPADQKLKRIGAWNFIQTDEGLESFFIALLTRAGHSKEEVEAMCSTARGLFKNPKTHGYYDMYNVVGRKPESSSS